jgi:hypothetical protein
MFQLIQINKIGVSNFVIKYMLSGSPKMDEKTKRKMVVSAKQLSSAEKLVYEFWSIKVLKRMNYPKLQSFAI